MTGLEDTFVIGIAGASAEGLSAGSGKDFVAGLLTRRRIVRWEGEWVSLGDLLARYGEPVQDPPGDPLLPTAIQMNLADIIKEHAAEIYGFNPLQLWGSMKDSPCSVDRKGGVPPFAPREVFQWFGTEGGRNFDPTVWLHAMERRFDRYARALHTTRTGTYVRDRPSVLVIGDIRFPNEVDWIHELGGELWFVASPRPGAKMGDAAHHDSEAWSVELRALADEVIEAGTKEWTAETVRLIVNADRAAAIGGVE